MRRFELTNELKEAMVDAARRRHPAEACGIVADSVFYELPNHAGEADHFRILAEDIARVATDHGGYEAVWHSHPSGRPEPSKTDWAFHPYGKALVVVAGESVNVYYADES